MRNGLRWKILLLTVLTPATLGVATLFTVNRNVTAHVSSSSIHENLEHSVAVFESMLRTRWRILDGGAHVIARDPRFFSLLMLGPGQRDSPFLETVKGMASDFKRITQTDLFEVVDRRGQILASVGSVHSTKASRDPLMRVALRGKKVEAILARGSFHYQVSLIPVVAGTRVVGVLLLGVPIGSDLARELHSQMRCEVTFLSGTTITGTSLSSLGDQDALVAAVSRLRLDSDSDVARLPVQQVRAPSALYLTVVRRIPGSDPDTPQLYVMQRAFDPETSFLHLMRRDMVILAVIALFAALVTGLVLSEQVLRPLQALVRGAQEMEKGNYDHPLEIKRRDEIGYLMERFVVMRQNERAYLSSLEQAMQLKSQFLSIASHELRTPISVLIGYRDMLAAGNLGPVTPEQAQAYDKMQTHLTRLTALAEDAARFARVRSERIVLDLQPHAVEIIVRRAVVMANAAGAGRSVSIETSTETFPEPIEVDGPRLEDAITQLITNGIRYTPDGGRVEVRAHRIDGLLQIVVRDTGIGIAGDRLSTLVSAGFSGVETNTYQSTTGLQFNSSGLGLGLSIARAVAEAHGGAIRAESRLGEGSTFTLEIPLVRDGEMPAAA